MRKVKLKIGNAFNSIPTLYSLVAIKLGADINENTRYDCTKLCVSQDIQDKIFDSDDDKVGMAMRWVIYGPKAIDSLSYREVEVEDGFVYEVEKND